ncbi:hypothetical protein M422DRAFT_260277 [Sphaerobolus stellatus SS14]|uniref:JmjC domain-containing protein n=1 Tax=Sphaerobolus stellatus (strain SS14) TaxID=990650 RepID=A0A0C9URB7_SPHS4|nr:hypothetical protein M422DRAFT_260277 [Sphaerobolus stellatus SS14]
MEEGAILTLPPGVPRAVFSITDSLAEGGHFFLLSALEASFAFGLRQHISGNPASHVASDIILHGLLTHYFLAVMAAHPAIIKEIRSEKFHIVVSNSKSENSPQLRN